MRQLILACLFCMIPTVAQGQSHLPNDESSHITDCADDASSLDQVLSRWEQSQREIKSLAVEFTLVFHDKLFQTKKKSSGLFRLVRTPDGNVRASCQWTPEKPDGPRLIAGLLDSRTIYFFDDAQKLECHLKLGRQDPIKFLADWFNPCAILLDRKRAAQLSEIEMKRDETYTYLHIKPKQTSERTFRLGPPFTMGRAVLMNVDSANVPKGMPKQLWHCQPNGNEILIEIKSWRMNAADGPTVEELDKSVNLEGWTVLEWECGWGWKARMTMPKDQN